MTPAQKKALIEVCETNGGGISLFVTQRDGENIPSGRVWQSLWDKDLIQGKAGAFNRVVHTRKGWDTYKALKK